VYGIGDQKPVRVLVDKRTKTVVKVNNQSAEIVRMLSTEMRDIDRFGGDDNLHIKVNTCALNQTYRDVKRSISRSIGPTQISTTDRTRRVFRAVQDTIQTAIGNIL
jgi:glutathionyl-hydroquinone reductase